MRTKLYAVQFSYHLMTDSQSVLEQWSWNPRVSQSSRIMQISLSSWILHNSPNSWKKTKLPENFKQGQERIQTQGKAKEIPTPHPSGEPPFIKWAWHLCCGISPLVSLN